MNNSSGAEVSTRHQGTLALRPDQSDWTELQKAAFEQLGIDKAPRGDQLVFLHVAQRLGLDPFNKEIYLIGRPDNTAPGRTKWTIQVGIDGFRIKSEEHSQYAGVGDAEWCGPDGQWVDVWVSEKPPVAARFTVYRRDQERPTRSVALYREYVQTKFGGGPVKRWLDAPAGQLAKCAEALARRTAFPRTLAGVTIPEEMDHIDSGAPPVVVRSERVSEVEPNWDGLISEAVATGDPAKLREVGALARGLCPNNLDLAERIARTTRDMAQLALPATSTDNTENGDDRTRGMRHIFALLNEGGINEMPDPREARLLIASHLVRPSREITSFNDLTDEDVHTIRTTLQDDKEHGSLGKSVESYARLGRLARIKQILTTHQLPEKQWLLVLSRIVTRVPAVNIVADLTNEEICQISEYLARHDNDGSLGHELNTLSLEPQER